MSKKKRSSANDFEIGRRIKLRRLEIGMSQESLGKALALTFQQIQKYEKGTNRVGSGRLQEIAKILDVPVTFFFGDLGGTGGSAISAMLESAFSLRMLKAFSRIRSHTVQRSTVELVESIADATDQKAHRA
jgi:transcriptional regulator with XRE-family HTH domain